MNERIEEQPFDERHDTPPRFPDVEPREAAYVGRHDTEPVNEWGGVGSGTFTEPERGKAQTYVAPENTVSWPQTAVSTGLVWRFSPGQQLDDLGRITPDVVESLSELDLRVILAHLDSAAHTIQIELGRR